MINAILSIAVVIMVFLLIPTAYRVWRGPSPGDRLQASDLLTTLLIGLIVLLAIIEGNDLLIDMGIALAAFSFVGTLAIARYISEGRIF